ncbi:uncharacterized protein LY89DRAFT_626565 [Mollisia scopiformis]|uniref:Luciferase domain-containing protein n=1 Tax=Mollisia scopiformis TaxID=149040 RepID=A0A194WTL5_MOLSC|nr:uncharacterized protein LY89DRAFT_626565 [Mollisia scopiformis]KUJ10957.1 hypothetical protein LY89DRAFT_626565 [Mollisia scopiformis]
MTSTLPPNIQHLINPRNALLTTISLPILYLAYTDYRAWLSVGRGGLPHNPFGYLIATLLRPLKAARFDTSFISNPRILEKSGPAGEKAHLSEDDIPRRKGERPEVCGWILPQRQLNQKATEDFREYFQTLITSLASSQPSQLQVSISVLERTGPALFIHPSIIKHLGAGGTRNEIAHLHESDGSMHVSLAPSDAKLIIERGWGERFGLSGSILPVTYTMVYAPRDEEEMRIAETIVRAGVKFMLGEEV